MLRSRLGLCRISLLSLFIRVSIPVVLDVIFIRRGRGCPVVVQVTLRLALCSLSCRGRSSGVFGSLLFGFLCGSLSLQLGTLGRLGEGLFFFGLDRSR